MRYIVSLYNLVKVLNYSVFNIMFDESNGYISINM